MTFQQDQQQYSDMPLDVPLKGWRAELRCFFFFLPPVMSLSKDFFQKNVDVSVSKTFKHPVLRNYKTWLRAGATHVGQSWTFQPSDGGFLSLFSSSVALIASEKSCTSYLKTSMSFLFKPSLHWVCSFHRATLERTTEPKICSCVLSHKNEAVFFSFFLTVFVLCVVTTDSWIAWVNRCGRRGHSRKIDTDVEENTLGRFETGNINVWKKRKLQFGLN